jgi:hypothetical protein
LGCWVVFLLLEDQKEMLGRGLAGDSTLNQGWLGTGDDLGCWVVFLLLEDQKEMLGRGLAGDSTLNQGWLGAGQSNDTNEVFNNYP